MIKPNELRLGNWVYIPSDCLNQFHNDSNFVEVMEVLQDGINLTHGDNTMYESAIIEGIKLTPEVLLKAGFVASGLNGQFYYHGDIYFSHSVNELLCYIEGERSLPVPNIKYLHQIQNLLFALTGEELEINL